MSLIDPRKFAAIDILFLGPKFVIAEFAFAVAFSPALGIFVLLRGRSFWQVALALYFISLGINYVPMLLYAIAIARDNSARAEIGDELNDKRRAMTKYRRQSLALLIPLVVPAAALARERQKTRSDNA